MRSDAVLGMARISLLIYSGNAVPGRAMRCGAWKCKDWFVNL